jgi:DNA-directed RNA polymerase subunit RPC12/RpoP
MIRASKSFRKQVNGLFRHLPSLSAAQTRFIQESTTAPGRFSRGNHCECYACGHKWAERYMYDKLTCPHCGTRLTMKRQVDSNLEASSYYVFVTVFHGYQVFRYFRMRRSHYTNTHYHQEPGLFGEANVRERAISYYSSIDELGQIWFNDKGEEVIVCRAQYWSMYEYFFNYNTELKIRNIQRIKWLDATVYPRMSFTPTVIRNGGSHLRDGFLDVCPAEYVEAVLGYPFLETLAKSKYERLFGYMVKGDYMYHPKKYEAFIRSAKVAMRHGVDDFDWGRWNKNLERLETLHMDTLNPKYIADPDLVAVSAALENKIAKMRERQELERLRAELQRKLSLIRDKNADYVERLKSYLPLHICDGDGLMIRPLQSVDDFYQEGEAMHHCVFNASYYDKPDTLILSAKVEGQRAETIEVSLSTFKVIQSRGKHNQDSPYHSRILALMKKNMNKIKQIKTATA